MKLTDDLRRHNQELRSPHQMALIKIIRDIVGHRQWYRVCILDGPQGTAVSEESAYRQKVEMKSAAAGDHSGESNYEDHNTRRHHPHRETGL
jgi:hypothetical protein